MSTYTQALAEALVALEKVKSHWVNMRIPKAKLADLDHLMRAIQAAHQHSQRKSKNA